VFAAATDVKLGNVSSNCKTKKSFLKEISMNENYIGFLIFLILGLLLHFLKIYLSKVLIKEKEKYQVFLKSDESKTKLKYNLEKYKLECFEVYVNVLGYGKWACLIFGILSLFRAFFEYFK
jgi:hypothetical protein